MVAVKPGKAPMITPTKQEAKAKKIDSSVMKETMEWPKAKSPSNIRAT
jgi:hypothetical protein